MLINLSFVFVTSVFIGPDSQDTLSNPGKTASAVDFPIVEPY
jgi:hypothetical protein